MNSDLPPPSSPHQSNLVQPVQVILSEDVLAIEAFFKAAIDPAIRQALIADFSGTPELRREFERSRKLPEGSFELLQFANDQGFQNTLARANSQFLSSPRGQEDVAEYVRSCLAFSQELAAKYPGAYRILLTYADSDNKKLLAHVREVMDSRKERYELAEALLPIDAIAVINAVVLVNLIAATNVDVAVKVMTQVLVAVDTAVVVNTEVSVNSDPA